MKGGWAGGRGVGGCSWADGGAYLSYRIEGAQWDGVNQLYAERSELQYIGEIPHTHTNTKHHHHHHHHGTWETLLNRILSAKQIVLLQNQYSF